MMHMKVKTPAFVPGFFSAMDKILNDDYSPVRFGSPAVNIVENEKDFTIEMMAPGMQKSDFRIALDEKVLTISYQQEEEKTTTETKYVRREFSTKSFSRSFTVNEKLNVDEISARYENGILYVVLPKTEVKEKEVKNIEIN